MSIVKYYEIKIDKYGFCLKVFEVLEGNVRKLLQEDGRDCGLSMV